MTRQSHNNGALFGVLMTLGALLVFAAWLPSARDSLQRLFAGVSEGAEDSQKKFTDQWKDTKGALEMLLPQFAAQTPEAVGSLLSGEAKEDLLVNVERTLDEPDSAKTNIVPPYDASAKKFCTRNGGAYHMKESKEHPDYGVCSFSNNSQCEAAMFEFDLCHVGQYANAEVGIPAKPDLVIGATAPLTIVNRGWALSIATDVSIGGKLFPIPALPIGGSYTVPAVDTAGSRIIIDPKDINKEIIEDNNREL